jgi:hypothetical protein
MLFSVAVLVCCGCGPTHIAPKLNLLDLSQANIYRDWDWLRVLEDYVSDGLVDYAGLSKKPEALQRYYALLSITGPTLTSANFTNRHQVIAYWINAYNALVLCAVLNRYPTTTVYDLSMPRLEHGYLFSVDGKVRTLADIERELFKLSDGDVRVLFALSRGALGSPPLSNRPIRATTLDRQLNELSARALDYPHILRIDYNRQSILVWQLIVRREEDFVRYMRARRRYRTAFLYNALLELSSPSGKTALTGAVGYLIRPIAFDRTLNDRSSQNRGLTVP